MMTNDNSFDASNLTDHFHVMGNDERDHVLTTVITLEHTPIPTIY